MRFFHAANNEPSWYVRELDSGEPWGDYGSDGQRKAEFVATALNEKEKRDHDRRRVAENASGIAEQRSKP